MRLTRTVVCSDALACSVLSASSRSWSSSSMRARMVREIVGSSGSAHIVLPAL